MIYLENYKTILKVDLKSFKLHLFYGIFILLEKNNAKKIKKLKKKT